MRLQDNFRFRNTFRLVDRFFIAGGRNRRVATLQFLQQFRIQAEGLLKPSGQLFGISELEYHLKNPIYYGMFRWKGTLYRGNHTPLVRKSLFDQVQAVFKQANKPKLTRREFTFRGPLTCGYCGCQLTAEIKKGKYVYYRCTNAKGKCRQPYLREEVVDSILAEVVKGVQPSAEDADFLREGLKNSLEDQTAYHKDQLEALTGQYAQLQRRLEQIYLDKIDGKVSEEFWREQSEKWQKEQAQVRDALAGHEKASAVYFEEGILLLELAQQAYAAYVAAKPEKKRKILGLLLSNCILKDTTPTPTYRKPFCYLAEAAQSKEWLPLLDAFRNPTEEFRIEILTLKTMLEGAYSELAA